MNAPPRIQAIRHQEQLALDIDGTRVNVSLHDICQRNWSRVAVGELSEALPGQEARVFVKQFVDRRGEPHADHMNNELAGSRAATALETNGVRVMPVISVDQERLLLCYPWQILITPDELLRTNEAAFASRVGSLVDLARNFLDALHPCPEHIASGLKSKSRPYGGAARALNLKGMDIRNWAWPCSTPGNVIDGPPLVFDCGRPYLAPIEEAAAKLLVSFGLLNWGWPMRRFVRGPDAKLLERVATVFQPYVSRDAVLAEIDLQARVRMGEFQGSNAITRLGKRLTVEVIGRRYLRRLRRQCTQLSVAAAESGGGACR
ncbi:MAG: hypothetical protein AB8H80_03435 [Planctomycetota bacterium]